MKVKKICQVVIQVFRKENGSPTITFNEDSEGMTRKDMAMLAMEYEQQKLNLLKEMEDSDAGYEVYQEDG